jgi:hypothetical protein
MKNKWLRLLVTLQKLPEAARIFVNIGREIEAVERQLLNTGIELSCRHDILSITCIS